MPADRKSLGPDFRVGVLTVALVTAAVSVGYLIRLAHWHQILGHGHPPVALLAVAFGLFEVGVVHLEYRHEVHSLSLCELAIVPGLIFFPPFDVLIAYAAGSLVALVLHRRQWSIKLPFNLAHQSLSASLAIVVFRAILGTHPALSLWGSLAAVVAVFSLELVGIFAVLGAVSLYASRLQKALLREGLAFGLLASVVTTSVGMLACGVIWGQPDLSWLLVVIVAEAAACFRAWASLRKRYSSLERLYSFTSTVATSTDPTQAVGLLLTRAADLLRTEVSEITLFDDSGTAGLRTMVVDGQLQTVPVTFDTETSLEMTAAKSGSTVLATRLTKNSAYARGLADRQFKDALLIPLRRNGSVVGTFLVANRLGHVTTFDAEDVKLLETIGLHASTTLENGRLIDRLRDEAASKEYQSLHDQLTGLPNRTMFHRFVERALEKSAEHDDMVAVLLMDLDRFKEVNDTLGHHTGDLLLIELSNRLRQVVGASGHIARLGGDEFAILVPAVRVATQAEHIARTILSALEKPLALTDINLQIGASIGVALYPDHARDSAALLQLADVAMYQAKANHSGYALYTSRQDLHDARRLALASELRAAIEDGALVVHYQPKADVASRTITGVEALVRWQHPRFGLVPPDEFIPIAEHTGLISLLTDRVLERSLRQCRAWQQMGLHLSLAVNLSVRNLVDRDLPARIGALLAEVGLPADVLNLEITESTIMADPQRTLEILLRLAAMGITLSIDDFGTGYSSLSYLKRLPVHQVKIDKSFVKNLTSDGDDRAIVQSVIDLARNLHLGVVAEGVENIRTWDCLAKMGCGSIQGYYLSRPMDPEVLTSRLLLLGLAVDRWVGDQGEAGALASTSSVSG